MRIPVVAFYTLAALTAKDITQIAIASSIPPTPDSNSDTNAATSEAFSEDEVEAIAPLSTPETLPISVSTNTAPVNALQSSLNAEDSNSLQPANLRSPTQSAAITPPEPLSLPERTSSPSASPASPSSPPSLSTPGLPPSSPLVSSITQSHWAQTYLEVLAANGIIQGFYEDGSLRPDAIVTRSQFAAMLHKAFPSATTRPLMAFSDVPTTHWAYAAIQDAYQAGFLPGQPDGTFAPNQPITQQEAIAALSRGLRLSARELFSESTSQHIAVAQGQLDQAATRADVAVLIYQAMVRQNRVPDQPIRSSTATGMALLGTQSRAIATMQPNSMRPYSVQRSPMPTTPMPVAQPQPTSPASSGGTLVASIDYFPGLLLAQTPQTQTPSAGEIRDLQNQLQDLETAPDFGNEFEGSPAITISNPSGFGADNFRGFVNFSFQSETRYTDEADGSMGIGIGLGDARENVGFQLSYTIASFGGSRDFGTGGFNAKLHRQFGDGWSAALGWEGFATTGDVDFEDSIYGSVTKIFRTANDLDDPFSRVAFTAGLGNGRFRTEEDVADGDDTIGVFGSVAVRIARPVSAVVEWTGQDLAVGLSVTPFRNVPWVITPAVRDIAGAGDGARFVLGTGISFQF
jgi:hypothetical protein